MAAYSERDAGWTDSRDGIDFYRFIYATEGKAVVQINGVTYNIEPNRVYLLRPKTFKSYEITVEQKAKLYWCHFCLETQDFKFIKLLKLPFTSSIPIQDGQYVISIILRMMDALGRESITSRLKLKAAILELMSYFVDNSALMVSKSSYYELLESGEKWTEVIDYIEKNLHQNIQIEDLAKVAYLHPNYLITSFKTVMGCSPIQYVTERRLEMAKKLLKETDLPISEIASKVGMLNHYLPRLLKRQTGITPKQYRRLMQVDIRNINSGNGNSEVKE
ncbi:AraC family transcriptional regulator [Paenibacillus glycanilyticus]|uniref:AraC family transcriptional regulator n=1 Tax=Paenibacillus glycanilyticus TaxID=126569 RepID=UPI00203DB952|nr:AraC family transcriptional regulator [Paenibacillus glycanilyticus]MCM3630529.1 AraC family transcriptional regulator [Paenibacillus glycanilyticus]